MLRTQATGAGSTITNTYDIMGWLSTATEGGASLTYVYDNLGGNTSFTDQANRTSTYTLRPGREPSQLDLSEYHGVKPGLRQQQPAAHPQKPVQRHPGHAYNILDQPTGITLANGTSVSYSFDY